jgi:hypothetical protein
VGVDLIVYNLLFQVCLALHGPDMPMARSPLDKIRRKEVFDIIAPYTMSHEDMEVFEAAPERLQDLWLESFTASLKGILFTSLQRLTKDEFSKCFPSHGASPAQIHGTAVGILPGQSILDRCTLNFLYILLDINIMLCADGKSPMGNTNSNV